MLRVRKRVNEAWCARRCHGTIFYLSRSLGMCSVKSEGYTPSRHRSTRTYTISFSPTCIHHDSYRYLLALVSCQRRQDCIECTCWLLDVPDSHTHRTCPSWFKHFRTCPKEGVPGQQLYLDIDVTSDLAEILQVNVNFISIIDPIRARTYEPKPESAATLFACMDTDISCMARYA